MNDKQVSEGFTTNRKKVLRGKRALSVPLSLQMAGCTEQVGLQILFSWSTSSNYNDPLYFAAVKPVFWHQGQHESQLNAPETLVGAHKNTNNSCQQHQDDRGSQIQKKYRAKPCEGLSFCKAKFVYMIGTRILLHDSLLTEIRLFCKLSLFDLWSQLTFNEVFSLNWLTVKLRWMHCRDTTVMTKQTLNMIITGMTISPSYFYCW